MRLCKTLVGYNTNDHSQILCKLKDELEARQRLNAEHQSLQAKRRKVETETKEQLLSLGKLPSYLQVIKQACKPLVHLAPNMGQRQARDLVHGLLPQPLSLIYSQLEGLIAGGLLGRAGLMVEHQCPVNARLAGFLVERSSCSVKIIFEETEVTFYTLPCMGEAVVVEPSDATLVNLFPGDSGDRCTSPEAMQCLMNAGAGPSPKFPCEVLGRPFSWAQWLGGLTNWPVAHAQSGIASLRIASSGRPTPI